MAARACTVEAVRALLANGARTDLKNKRGQTALMVAQLPGDSEARRRLRQEVVRLLVAHEAQAKSQ